MRTIRIAILRFSVHENTHAVTNLIKARVSDAVVNLNKDDIIAYRAEKMGELYQDNEPDYVLNEIISYFVEEIPRHKFDDYLKGELLVYHLLMDDWQINNTIEEKYVPIFKELMPLIGENLKIQKHYYNEKGKNAFIIAREFSGKNGEQYEEP